MTSAPPWRIAPGDDGYPGWLSHLGELAPPCLHGVGDRGVVSGLDHDATVTIVGSRRASSYGLRIAEQLGRDLASAGVTVISGMAWGIDAAAHRGALAGGGCTIAVLAGGPDYVYPPSNRGLYLRIVAAGAAVSEHPPGTRPYKGSFPTRNRIMAALAKLVIVVEAADPSGSLITARHAHDTLGLDVLAVPGQVGMRTAAGTNRLLRDGAPIVTCAEDVLDRLAGVGARTVRRSGPSLDAELGHALDLVAAGATTADALAVAGDVEPHRAAVALARLELLGYVAAGPDGSFARTALEAPQQGAEASLGSWPTQHASQPASRSRDPTPAEEQGSRPT
jgi:DNA processing protein